MPPVPLRQGALYGSYEDFQTSYAIWEETGCHRMRVTSSEKMRKTDGSIDTHFMYRILIIHCVHQAPSGKKQRSQSPKYQPTGCKAAVRVNYNKVHKALCVTTLIDIHTGHGSYLNGSPQFSRMSQTCSEVRRERENSGKMDQVAEENENWTQDFSWDKDFNCPEEKTYEVGRPIINLHDMNKPKLPYPVLTAMAIINSETGSMRTHEIYEFIATQFPHFRSAYKSWKNSIRTALATCDYIAPVNEEELGDDSCMNNKAGNSTCFCVLDYQQFAQQIHKFMRRFPDPTSPAYGLEKPELWTSLITGGGKYPNVFAKPKKFLVPRNSRMLKRTMRDQG